MRAVVQNGYGPIEDLSVHEVPRPEPQPDEVLIRVHAASIHPDVWHVVTGYPRVLRLIGSGVRRPNPPIPGTDVSGVVVEVGSDVDGFDPGDAVYGEVLRGLQWRNGATYAEYVAAPTTLLRPKPPWLPHDAASAVGTAGLIALENLGDGEFVRPGHRVLVNGAGGGVGMMAVQIAVAAGAVVTAVDRGDKEELLVGLGAHRTVDYRLQDYTTMAERFDLVFDVVGNRPPGQARRIVRDGGRYVLIGHDHFGDTGNGLLGSLPRFARIVMMSAWVPEFRTTGGPSHSRSARMDILHAMVEAGEVRPVIDRTYPLEAVPRALTELTTGRSHGRIVITVADEG